MKLTNYQVIWISSDNTAIQKSADFLAENGVQVRHLHLPSNWQSEVEKNKPESIVISGIPIPDVIKTLGEIKGHYLFKLINFIYICDSITETERELYYDAEGDTLLCRPYLDTELLHLFAADDKHRQSLKIVNQQVNEASQMAMLAMENSSDLGGVIAFAKGAIRAHNLEDLAKHIIDATSLYSTSTLIELKGYDDYHYFCSNDDVKASLKKVLKHNKSDQRVIRFGDGLQVNNSCITIIVNGLPIDDTEKMGRISDNMVIFCELADRFAKTLGMELGAEKNEESRRLFMTTLSHELRTPLNAVLGFSKLLSNKKVDDTLNENTVTALSSISEGAERINSIFNTLVDITKHSTGKADLSISEIDIQSIVSSLNVKFSALAQEKEIELLVNSPESQVIETDDTKLRIILSNLLDNAIKFTDKGRVQLNIEFSESSNKEEFVKFEVVDTGVGLSQFNQEKIMTGVGQLDNSHGREKDGLGLGLFYARLYARQLGGEIKLKSIPDKGSSFTLVLQKTCDVINL